MRRRNLAVWRVGTLSWRGASTPASHSRKLARCNPLIIVFGPTIIPSTFVLNLKGVDVSSQFTPAPGLLNVVTLALQPGRNILLLSVNGQLPGRTVTDKDRLVFVVS